MNDDFILKFYARIAQSFGHRSDSTMQDKTIRSYEVAFACQEIQHFIETYEFYPSILELGCGNGTLLQEISQRFPACPLIGLEFTPELYQLAVQRNLPKTELILGDMRKIEDFPAQADIIITERSLINLASWEQQKMALTNIAGLLKFPSRLIMMESFYEPWVELNQGRKEMNLSLIPQSPQNVYLKEKTARWLTHQGFFERKTEMGINALSNHFYLSRVFHNSVRPTGGKQKGSRMVRFFNQILAPSEESYSPILFRSFERKLI